LKNYLPLPLNHRYLIQQKAQIGDKIKST